MSRNYSSLRHIYREILQLIRRHAIGNKLRIRLLKMSGANIGKNVFIGQEFFVFDSGRTEQLTIEDNVGIAPYVIILIHSDPGPTVLRERYPIQSLPVTIKQGAWIGIRVTILGGITIGEHSVVAAGSVVTKDVPPYTLVAGVPAVVRKRLPRPNQEEKKE